MNIAVELDPKIYQKAQKETVFTPIKSAIKKPEKVENDEKKKTKLLLKERKALNHLAKTCSLISSLNNDDLIMMKNVKEKEKERQEKQRGN